MTNKTKKSYNKRGGRSSSSSNSLVDGTKSLFKSGKLDLSPVSEKNNSNLQNSTTLGGGILIIGLILLTLKLSHVI
jgi:hypothetical protein